MQCNEIIWTKTWPKIKKNYGQYSIKEKSQHRESRDIKGAIKDGSPLRGARGTDPTYPKPPKPLKLPKPPSFPSLPIFPIFPRFLCGRAQAKKRVGSVGVDSSRWRLPTLPLSQYHRRYKV